MTTSFYYYYQLVKRSRSFCADTEVWFHFGKSAWVSGEGRAWIVRDKISCYQVLLGHQLDHQLCANALIPGSWWVFKWTLGGGFTWRSDKDSEQKNWPQYNQSTEGFYKIKFFELILKKMFKPIAQWASKHAV